MINYSKIRLGKVNGRYINYTHIHEFISALPKVFKIDNLGDSVKWNSIKSITFGVGPNRILIWSQMHGNESTTTKSVIDYLNYLNLDTVYADEISKSFTIKIIPILNPDGALAYTRVNANGIDLNRDAQDLSQPESRILRNLFTEFKPNFCFNLHDQRTIFNVGSTNKPATVSFLAPAFNPQRSNSPSRLKSMQLIAAMNTTLQTLIPGQVGRYGDGFNANCVGDAFQMTNTPTILFEAGHYAEDYSREKTREFVFKALVKCFETIKNNNMPDFTEEDYFKIPENSKQFVDIVVRNANVINSSFAVEEEVYFQYKEVLKMDKIKFEPQRLLPEDKSLEVFGHLYLDCTIANDRNWLNEKGIVKLLS